MEFWDIVKVVVLLGVVVAVVGFLIWAFAYQVMELFQFSAGMHDLDLSYQISSEDIESLTKEEWKKTRRMSYEERTAFLKERFPNSVPEFKTDLELL